MFHPLSTKLLYFKISISELPPNTHENLNQYQYQYEWTSSFNSLLLLTFLITQPLEFKSSSHWMIGTKTSSILISIPTLQFGKRSFPRCLTWEAGRGTSHRLSFPYLPRLFALRGLPSWLESLLEGACWVSHEWGPRSWKPMEVSLIWFWPLSKIRSSLPPFTFFSSFLRLVPLMNNLQGLPYFPNTSQIRVSSDRIKSRDKVKESAGVPTVVVNELY